MACVGLNTESNDGPPLNGSQLDDGEYNTKVFSFQVWHPGLSQLMGPLHG